MSTEELRKRIEELEKELSETKYNKRTQHAIGLLKAKIARLRDELEKRQSKSRHSGIGYAVKKEGDVTIGLVGKPSVGKSTILTKLTNKESKIGAYEFTTLDVVPGLMNYEFVNFQILDLPGIIEGASKNKGFGRKVLSVVRSCDMILLVIDARNIKDIDILLKELNESGIRVNKERPNIKINRTHSGGIKIVANLSNETLPEETIKEILRDNKIMNAEVLISEKGVDIYDLIDALYNNLTYVKGAIILNKIDLLDKKTLEEKIKEVKEKYPGFSVATVSADKNINLNELKRFIYKELGFIKIYLKEPRKEPDLSRPLIVREGDSIKTVCEKIHKDFVKRFRFAKIKGNSVKFDWQRVGLDHEVSDGDIIEITLK